MNEEVMNPGTTGMVVNEKMKADLLTSAKWAKFLCIAGCIGLVFIVIVAIVMFAFGSSSNFGPTPEYGAVKGFTFLILAALYVYPLIKGFQFANAAKAACLNDDESELARAFDGMRSWFTYSGILTIIVLAIYALFFLIAIIGGVAIASHSF